MLIPVAALALLAAVVVLLANSIRKRVLRPHLPPGPPGYPIIGNIFDSAGIFDWRKFFVHRTLYGDMTSVTLLGRTVVTVHTYEKAVELMDKKSLIYSSRPGFKMFELAGWQDHVSLLPYGSQLRSCRRMIRSEINNTKMQEFYPHQERTTRRLLRTLVNEPEEFFHRAEWYPGSVVLKIAYGYDTLENDDPFINLAHKALVANDGATKPGQLIEVIPWLRYVPTWLPMAGFKRRALVWRDLYEQLLEVPFEWAKKAMESEEGGEPSNFVSSWINKIQGEEELLYLKESALVFFSAGVETTSGVLQVFFYRMQEFPEIQAKAQAELDAVVGRDRLPSFDDRANLPYINALCKELLRFNPPVPGGVPHQSTADDVHDGYFIPKGTVLIASVWEMTREPSVYKNPDEFNPSRFLGPNPERDPSLYVFGFGRRLCSGLPLAQNSLFIAVSMVLSCFNITPAATPQKLEHAAGLTSHPLPFKCTITPRPGTDVEELRKAA